MAPAPFLDRILAAHVTSRRTLAWAALLACLALALAFVPLFDVLGFEFSFVMALVASFAAADLGVALVRRARDPSVHPVERRAPPGRMVAGLFGRAAVAAAGLLLAPLAIISLNALRVAQCDWVTGGAFYALLPGLSVVLGSAVGVGSGLTLAGRPRLAVAAAWLLVAGSVALGVYRFYAAPPIFGYDPFVGFFPGSLYDEEVSLGAAFFWSRLYQASVAVAALAAVAAVLDAEELAARAARLRRPARAPAALALLAAAVAVALAACSARLGFAVDDDDIAAALGGRVETAHFVIHYPRAAPLAADIEAIARDHELRWEQLRRTLGVAPRGKITSYYFGSAADKQRWMGAGRTYIAKPWRREIYLSHEDFPHGSLRHEIAHVFAGEFGDPVFRVSVRWWGWPPARFNAGLIEGLAVAADWTASARGRMTPHQAARAMLDSGRLPPIARLLAPGFLTFSSARSYAAAGSFVKFLLDRHGPDRLRRLYRAGGAPADFARIYGRPLSDLDEQWRASLAEVAVDAEDRALASERFRRPALFGRRCARAVARRVALAGRLLAAHDDDRAVRVLRRVCADDAAEPTHRLALAYALERAGRGDEALAEYRRLATRELSVPLRIRVLTGEADLLARGGQLAAARARVDEALALPADDGTARSLWVRRQAFDEAAPGAAALRDFVLARAPDGGEPDPLVLLFRAQAVAEALPASGLGLYLEGRQLAARGAHADAARAFGRARELGLPDARFARENDRLLAAAAYLAGDAATARAAAGRLADPAQPTAVQLEGRDWIERLDFAAAGRL